MLVHVIALQLAAATVPAAATPFPPAAQPVATPAAAPTITVTGHRLADYAAELDACIAAHCSPRRDIVASIRYAEALFRSGDYHRAREVLAKATERNAHAGAEEPVALAQLYVAQASVAAHFGEQRDVEHATLASARVTHDFLPAGDPERLWADLRVADWRLDHERFERTGLNLAVADPAYVRIASEARASGHPDIAAAADLHRALALHARRDNDGALALLAKVAATDGDAVRPYRLAARIMTARIARERGDKHAIDAAIAALRAEPDHGAPILVYSPPFPKPTDPVYRDDPFTLTVDTITRPGDTLGLQWIDIGFGIRADGTVDDPEVLRSSRTVDWAKPLLTMIAGRRYSPTTAGDADAPGHYRVERYTLTADFGTPVGSLIRRRISEPRYEQLDLTDAGTPGKPASPGG